MRSIIATGLRWAIALGLTWLAAKGYIPQGGVEELASGSVALILGGWELAERTRALRAEAAKVADSARLQNPQNPQNPVQSPPVIGEAGPDGWKPYGGA